MDDLRLLEETMKKPWPAPQVGRIKARHLKLINEKTKEVIDLEMMERYPIAEFYLPQEVHLFHALKTTGNGNCLFNAVSISLCGKWNTMCG